LNSLDRAFLNSIQIIAAQTRTSTLDTLLCYVEDIFNSRPYLGYEVENQFRELSCAESERP